MKKANEEKGEVEEERKKKRRTKNRDAFKKKREREKKPDWHTAPEPRIISGRNKPCFSQSRTMDRRSGEPINMITSLACDAH